MARGHPTKRRVRRDDIAVWPNITRTSDYSIGEIERFLAKIDRSDIEGCWEWTSAITGNNKGRKGYGALTREGGYDGSVYAHRMSYELANGPLDGGMYTAHRCNNTWCVRPSHLYAATPEQNAADAVADGLFPRGESHYNSLLTEADVGDIFEMRRSFTSLDEIASVFGVSTYTISSVLNGRTWTHVDCDRSLPAGFLSARRFRPSDIVAIRTMRRGGRLLSDIAKRYGVHESMVSLICSGKRYGWVE